MTSPSPVSPPPTDSAYIAHLWEHPHLTLAIFGYQIHTPDGYAQFEKAGIPQEMDAALALAVGLLCIRFFPEGNGGLQLQYWRSHDDLSRFAHQLPHMAWWKWLNQHRGQGFSFYHEIYQCKTAEAVYELSSLAVGPATFCSTSAVSSGEGRSVERQRRFAEGTLSS